MSELVIDFVPKSCEGDNAQFKGSLKVNPPTVMDRFDYIEKLQVDSAMFEEDSKHDTMEYIKLAKELFPLAKKHVRGVDIVKVSNNYKIDTIEKLMTDASCVKIVMEVSSAILQGFDLGN